MIYWKEKGVRMKNLLIKMITTPLVIFIMIMVFASCAKNTNHPIVKEFIDEFPTSFKNSFFLLGDVDDIDLNKFKSVTFYVGTSNKINELDIIFRDYAKRIGTDHIAVFLEYGTQNYSKQLDNIKCFHLMPFEVPAIIYVDLQKEKCYYFSHSNGILLTDALLHLSKAIGSETNIDQIKTEFDIKATVEDLVEAFPMLKPLRNLILRISQHIFLN